MSSHITALMTDKPSTLLRYFKISVSVGLLQFCTFDITLTQNSKFRTGLDSDLSIVYMSILSIYLGLACVDSGLGLELEDKDLLLAK